jgi:hypothetical protein
MTNAEKLVEELLKHRWKSNPFDTLLPLLRDEPGELFPLALAMLEQIPNRSTCFDTLLSHLTEKEFAVVVEAAMLKVEAGKTESAESVIRCASLQFPHLLTPFLRDLFSLRPNCGTYCEEWPWRAADSTEREFLKQLVQSGPNQAIRKRAWRCLIQAGDREYLRMAAGHPFFGGVGDGNFDDYALWVGLDTSPDGFRRLHSNQSHHIIFPNGYFADEDRPPWLSRAIHPTWSLDEPGQATGRLGGTVAGECGMCGGPLHLLLEIDDASALLPIQVGRLQLCTCMSCLGWEAGELFFRHDASGTPAPFEVAAQRVEPEFPVEPLKASKVRYVPSTARWSVQDWALSNSRENLNRIGGAPCWVQSDQYPRCPCCDDRMFFIAQLDSELPPAGGGQWLWGSGGICYLFWCNRCSISANLWQCT